MEHNAIVNRYLSDNERYADLKQVFIRYSKDKKKLRELVENDDTYQYLDEDAYDMVALYTNSTELLELKKQTKEGDKVNMCQAIKEMMEDERAEGRAEGHAEGHAEEKLDNIRKMMKNLKLTAKQAMDVLEIPEEEQGRYLEMI